MGTANSVTIHVPGQIILSGELGVEQGFPAFIAAVDQYVQFSLEISGKECSVSAKHPTIICGTGYNEAVTVGKIMMLNTLYELDMSSSVIASYAHVIEKEHNRNALGLRTTTSSIGGFIWYRQEFDFLKNIWQIPMKIPKSLDHFYLIEIKPDNKKPINIIPRHVSKEKDYQSLYSIEQQTKKLLRGIRGESQRDVKSAFMETQRLIENFVIVSTEAATAIAAIEQSGGAAELIGFECEHEYPHMLLCYHPSNFTLEKVIDRATMHIIPVKLGADGAYVKTP
ncbi:hypothetical protein HY468_02995 [Candidatus Roizmanbacteria bacterium]|nr:hypothetical protein [Candidatus Roizmanbacteria bacterium]